MMYKNSGKPVTGRNIIQSLEYTYCSDRIIFDGMTSPGRGHPYKG